MNPLRWIILGVAALMAAGAVYFLVTSSQRGGAVPAAVQDVIEPEKPAIEVLAAAKTVKVGAALTKDDLAWIGWGALEPPATFVRRDQRPEAITELETSIVRLEIAAGEPIVLEKLLPVGETSLIASRLGPGMRALAVRIEAESASGGFILPDDRVDVLLTREFTRIVADGVEEQISTTDLVIGDVRVLAIDQAVAPPEGATALIGATATLEVAPADVEAVLLAERIGELTLSLRPISTEAAIAKAARRADQRVLAQGVRGRDSAAPEPPVRIYQGGIQGGANP